MIKQRCDQELVKEGRKTYWADIAIEAELPSYLRYKAGKTIYSELEIRKMMTVLAKRHYKKADDYIYAAITNQFP